MKAYRLEKCGKTNEIHIFEGNIDIYGNFTPKSKAVCKKMSDIDSVKNAQVCKTEKEIRFAAAEIGRDVCGNCVIQFYSTL